MLTAKPVKYHINPNSLGVKHRIILQSLLEQTQRQHILRAGESYDVTLPNKVGVKVTLTHSIVSYLRKHSRAYEPEYRFAVINPEPICEGSSAYIHRVIGTLFFPNADNSKKLPLEYKVKRNNRKEGKDNRRVVKMYKDLFMNENTAWIPVNESRLMTDPCIFPDSHTKKLSADSSGASLVMRYVPGIDLFDLLRERSLNLTQRINLVILIFKALDELHQRGIVHRDLSLENIRVTRNKDGDPVSVEIFDFGMSKRSPTESNREQARERDSCERLGSLSTISPEAYTPGRVTDERSDVYAAGRIAWRVLAECVLPQSVKEIYEFAALTELPGFFRRVSRQELSKTHRKEIKELLLDINSIQPCYRPSIAEIIKTFEQIQMERLQPVRSDKASLNPGSI